LPLDALPGLMIEKRPKAITITFNRAAQKNTLTQQMLNGLSQALNDAERDADCRVIVLRGQDGFFCTGMDFHEFVERMDHAQADAATDNGQYMDILRRLSSIGKVVICAVDGQVMAGGVGFLGAADLVLATPVSRFSLPEALWGLLPACVLPLLIRRIGFQNAYRMTLSTETWSAEQAHQAGLVDETTESLDDAIRKHLVRFTRLEHETISDIKAYFKKLWHSSEAAETIAVAEISRLVAEPRIQNNIRNFVEHKKFPWEKT